LTKLLIAGHLLNPLTGRKSLEMANLRLYGQSVNGLFSKYCYALFPLFKPMQNTRRRKHDGRPVHPVGESRFPLGQRLHFCPVTPGRHWQRPVICSQSSRS